MLEADLQRLRDDNTAIAELLKSWKTTSRCRSRQSRRFKSFRM